MHLEEWVRQFNMVTGIAPALANTCVQTCTQHACTHLTVLARLKGAEKRANTTPSMMKLTREEKMTCGQHVNGASKRAKPLK